MSMTKEESRALKESIKKLEALISTAPDSTCGVANEHKEAVRLYVQTWVLPNLRAIDTPAKERTHSDKQILSFNPYL
jgi:hypothetical protein